MDNTVKGFQTNEGTKQYDYNALANLPTLISQDNIDEAVVNALEQAKQNGDFKGDKGDDYILTEADKAEIAEMAAELIDIPDTPGGGDIDLDGYATQQWVQDQNYLKSIPSDYVTSTELTGEVNSALAQAKENGDFKGEPGNDYVLTEADKNEIAAIAADLIDIPISDGKYYKEIVSEFTDTVSEMGTLWIDDIAVKVGKNYLVKWNGIKYSCTAYRYNEEIVILDGIDYPFYFECFSDHIEAYVEDGSTAVTVAIYEEVAYATEEWVEEKFKEHSGGNHNSCWTPTKVGMVILPEQTVEIKNGFKTVGTIDPQYLINNTKIIAYIDGIPHESTIIVDGYDSYANVNVNISESFNGRVSFVFATTGTTIWSSDIDMFGHTVKICLLDYNVLPEECISNSDRRSDWNASEGEPGHILNRPFYTEPNKVVFPETKIEMTDKVYANIPRKLEIVIGEVYKVTVNGNTYVCTAVEDTWEVDDVIYSTPRLIVDGTSYADRIDIMVNPEEDETIIFSQIGVDVITLAIVHDEIHKIPEKYLPDNIVGSGGSVYYSSEKTYEEIIWVFDISSLTPTGRQIANGDTIITATRELYRVEEVEEDNVTGEYITALYETGMVKSVNGQTPDENGNVEIPVSGGNVENGEDGFSPIAKVEQTASGAVISITDKDGTTTATITNGKDGAPGETGAPGKDGKDGTSVTITKVTESTADGGSNVATFSDGKTLTVKNGKTGATGKDGVSVVSVTQTTTSTDDDGENIITVTLSNGNVSTFKIKNGTKGGNGANATINGVNSLTLNTTGGITKSQSGNTMTIGASLTDILASGPIILKEGTGYHYGDTLPAAGTKGRLFFKKVN